MRNVAAFLYSLVHTAGISRFDQRAIMHDRVVEPESSGEIIGFIAVALQNTAGNIASQTALADDINRLAFFDLAKAIAQLVNGDRTDGAARSRGLLQRRTDH